MKKLWKLDNNEYPSDYSSWFIIADSIEEAMDLFVQSKGGFYGEIREKQKNWWEIQYELWRYSDGRHYWHYFNLFLINDTFEKGVYDAS